MKSSPAEEDGTRTRKPPRPMLSAPLQAAAPTAQPPWQRGKKMTLARIARAIDEGLGCGEGELYKPWIRVRRRLASPVSNLFVESVPLYRHRGLHLLSRLEHDAALLLIWLGVASVREQFPMWPWPHPHPSRERSFVNGHVVQVPGLLEIADRTEVAHGVYPGTKLPYVGTMDFLCEVPAGSGMRLVGIACKPQSKVETSRRARERLLLEQRYCESIGAHWSLFTDDVLSGRFCGNLDWFTPKFGEITAFQKVQDRLEVFARAFNRRVEVDSIAKCRAIGASEAELRDTTVAGQYFRMAAYRGLINIDFRYPVIMTKPLRRDVQGYKKQLAERFLGNAS